MADAEGTFRKEDMFMLLEAYKNQVDSNRTLMEQQGRLLDQHNSILEKQALVAESVSALLDKLGVCNDGLKDKLVDSRTDCLKEHNGLKQRMYVAYIGMGTLILGLVGLLITSYERTALVKETSEALNLIVTHLGIGV